MILEAPFVATEPLAALSALVDLYLDPTYRGHTYLFTTPPKTEIKARFRERWASHTANTRRIYSYTTGAAMNLTLYSSSSLRGAGLDPDFLSGRARAERQCARDPPGPSPDASRPSPLERARSGKDSRATRKLRCSAIDGRGRRGRLFGGGDQRGKSPRIIGR